MSLLKVLRAALATALLGTVLIAMPTVASAAPVYRVTTTADSNDGSCTHALCSFRDALTAAEITGGTVRVPAGHYVASLLGSNGVWSPDGEFTVRGAGAHKTI